MVADIPLLNCLSGIFTVATERHTVKAYFNDKEKQRLDEMQAQMRLSRSEILRRLLMNTPLPSASDFAAWEAVRDLYKINADLARLGNLLKLTLDEPLSENTYRKYDRLALEIEETRQTVKTAARDISSSVRVKKSAKT